MEADNNSCKACKPVKSTVITGITHLLIPLLAFPFAFFVVPEFIDKAEHFKFEPAVITRLVFQFSGFICSFWYVAVLIVGVLIAVDAGVYFKLFTRNKRLLCKFWSAGVIGFEFVLACVSVWSLLILLESLSNIPHLCPAC